MRSRVDLPQPEVPTRETISCSPTERLTPSSARWARLAPASEPGSPNTLPTLAISSIARLLRLAEAVLPGQRAPRERLDQGIGTRSEARRVGKECVRTCRSRWSQHH